MLFGFRRGRGCLDRVFSVKQLIEKYVSKGKDLFVAYMDLEKRMIELTEMQCGGC